MIGVINHFLEHITAQKIELYGESGLQHEIALFIRTHYPDYLVRLEYPTTRIFNGNGLFVKKEIDLYVTNNNGNERFAIELKLHKDPGGVPKSMYEAIKDIKFSEQLMEAGFTKCFTILFSSNNAFWAPMHGNGIYQMFYPTITISTLVLGDMPNFLHYSGELVLNNLHLAEWIEYIDLVDYQFKYFVISIGDNAL